MIEKYPLKVVLYKKGEMIYFSHLDTVRILERALRRSNLPVYYTKGFNPHIKMSFSKALKLGEEGEIEVTFYFSQEIPFQQLKEKLMPQLPSGLETVECKKGG
jgi:radical SAM-linked protein